MVKFDVSSHFTLWKAYVSWLDDILKIMLAVNFSIENALIQSFVVCFLNIDTKTEQRNSQAQCALYIWYIETKVIVFAILWNLTLSEVSDEIATSNSLSPLFYLKY